MNKQIANKKIKQRGFTLLELSVVLIILGFLIYMTLIATTAQLESTKIKQTQDRQIKIQNALVIFYKINGRLPCPANGAVTNSDGTFGLEQPKYNSGTSYSVTDNYYNDITCQNYNYDDSATSVTSGTTKNTVYVGVVPTRSLGLPDDVMLDGWNDRMTYVVSKFCLDPDNWSTSNTYKCSTLSGSGGTITGSASVDGSSIYMNGKNSTNWPTQAAYLVISHGKYGMGAYSQSGSRITSGSGSIPYSNNELNNGNLASVGVARSNTTGAYIYNDLPINNGDVSYYDNLVVWNTAGQVDYNANH